MVGRLPNLLAHTLILNPPVRRFRKNFNKSYDKWYKLSYRYSRPLLIAFILGMLIQSLSTHARPTFIPEITPVKAQAEQVEKLPERTTSPVTLVAIDRPPVTDVQGLIRYWASYYGVDVNWLLRVARCESGFNPNASNKGYTAGGGHPSGVFQFLPNTFARYSGRAGFSGDVWNASDNIRAAAYAFSVGGSGEWACT